MNNIKNPFEGQTWKKGFLGLIKVCQNYFFNTRWARICIARFAKMTSDYFLFIL